MKEQLRVSLYIRVSTGRQANEGDSLEEQEAELRKLCDYRGFLIHRAHIERGKSAKDTNRPEYQKLLADVKDKKINAVIVKKLDRFSRSLLDFEQFMTTAQQNDVEFISLKENFDTTNAMGKAMLRVALVFAQLEREQTSERITDVMTYRAEQGLYNGGVTPYGYTSASKELVPYKKEKMVIELIFNKFIETESTLFTARFINETGHLNRNQQPFDERHIQKILINPVYIGKVPWKGSVYTGIHQPIITEKKFDLVQDIFAKRKHVIAKNKAKALLQGMLFCGCCSSPMSPSHSLNKKKLKYYYYRCSSTKSTGRYTGNYQYKYVPFEKIDNGAIEMLLSLSQESYFSNVESKILEHNRRIERDKQVIKGNIALLEQSLDSAKQKKERYLDSLISSQFLSNERKRIDEKITELELEEKQHKAQVYQEQFKLNELDDDLIDLVDFKKRLIDFKSGYNGYSARELRAYIQANIKRIVYHPDKLVVQFSVLPWALDFNVDMTNKIKEETTCNVRL